MVKVYLRVGRRLYLVEKSVLHENGSGLNSRLLLLVVRLLDERGLGASSHLLPPFLFSAEDVGRDELNELLVEDLQNLAAQDF